MKVSLEEGRKETTNEKDEIKVNSATSDSDNVFVKCLRFPFLLGEGVIKSGCWVVTVLVD